MSIFRVKRAFTLIELILVILLTSSVYVIMFSSSSFFVKNPKDKFLLENTKEFLMNNYEFENKISLVCIEDKFTCFVSIDEQINTKTKIENVFVNIPEVYEYNKHRVQARFKSVRIDDIEYDVIFRFEINKDFKIKEYILDTLENKVYVFNSIFQKAKVLGSVNEAFETFEKKI